MGKIDSSAKFSFYNHPDLKLVEALSWDRAKRLEYHLGNLVGNAIDKNSDQKLNVTIQKTQHYSHGDFTTNIAFRLAQEQRKSPKEIVEDILPLLQNSLEISEIVDRVTTVGGYINFFLKKTVIIKSIIEAEESTSGRLLQGKRILFEYGHPNPFKMIHIGHLRNFIIGESLTRILEKLGAEVIRINYQGDVGMHVAKSIWGIINKLETDKTSLLEIEKLPIEERVKFIGQAYALGSTAYEENEVSKEEIKQINHAVYAIVQEKLIVTNNWQPSKKYSEFINSSIDMAKIGEVWEKGKNWSLEAFRSFYSRVGTKFEREYMESETLYWSDEAVKEAMNKNVLEESQGAIVFKGDKYGLDTRVFVNSLGLPTYEGKELGLAKLEFSDFGNIDLCIHNVAVEQISFFKVTFKVEELLNPGLYKGKQYHNAYEFVGLKSGKMSSRKGSVVLASEIIDEAKRMLSPFLEDRGLGEKEREETLEKIAVAAIKYSFLNISAFKYLSFDLETSVSLEGNSGPYLLYTYARANRIMTDYSGNLEGNALTALKEEEELLLLRILSNFDSQIIETGKHLSPNTLCKYLYELAGQFNSFYKKYPILNEKDPEVRKGRLVLTKTVAGVIKEGLMLLGIETVEKM